jgi:hypothetical protein
MSPSTRPQQPYARPATDRPVRVAFVGPSPLFSSCTPSGRAPNLNARFLDFRGEEPEALLALLAEHAPDLVVCFRPEHIPAGLFETLPTAVVGVAAEPMPHAGELPHEGLAWNLGELAKADRGCFDRVLVCDPAGFDTVAGLLPAWRAMPLPVDDRLFRAVRPARRSPRAVFIGHSTMHVEQFLVPVKHGFDVGHYASGLAGELLEEVLDGADIAINVHADPRVRVFEHRVLLHLAAGHLLLSESLEPTFGLEPDIDYLEIATADQLDLRMHQLVQRPDSYERVRIRGRAKAEQFRASRVWRSLVDDLFDDLAAFGTERSLRL